MFTTHTSWNNLRPHIQIIVEESIWHEQCLQNMQYKLGIRMQPKDYLWIQTSSFSVSVLYFQGTISLKEERAGLCNIFLTLAQSECFCHQDIQLCSCKCIAYHRINLSGECQSFVCECTTNCQSMTNNYFQVLSSYSMPFITIKSL